MACSKPVAWSGKRTAWNNAALVAWLGVGVLLLWVVAAYASYAADVVAYPFGLDYSEGLIWQQALWITGPHMYGDISRYPFMVFEYPPLYHLAVRALAATGLDMLFAGRALSLTATIVTAGLIGALVHQICRGFGRLPAMASAFVAALLPFTLAPVVAWSPLMRVDMLGMMFTYAGIVLSVRSFRRPAWLYAAMLCFVAACFTKQTFIAAPAAVLLLQAVRNPRLAVRAGAAAAALGLAAVGALSWLTAGGFLRHILLYNINRFSLAAAIQQAVHWLLAYSFYGALVAVSLALAWRHAHARRGAGGWRAAARRDDDTASLMLLAAYFVFSSATLILAGKSGATYNYFIEFLCLCCVWIGWLAGRALAAPPRHIVTAACVPLALVLQILPIPGGIGGLHAAQLSPGRTTAAKALLDRAKSIQGSLILSDDMVMVLRTHREVGMDQAILAELAAAGKWDENRLISMLKHHAFAAVVTAHDQGDPVFDARYLPRTQAALLACYPKVESFGDYRLRLP